MPNPFNEDQLPGRPWWRGVWWGGSAVVLAAFFIATTLSDAVSWTIGDFLAAAFLLALGGMVMEVSFRILTSRLHRAIAVVGAFALTVLLWAGLAAG